MSKTYDYTVDLAGTSYSITSGKLKSSWIYMICNMGKPTNGQLTI